MAAAIGALVMAAVLAAPAALAQGQKVLKIIPQADLRILDPISTTAYITRNHGYMIYDTLFAIDAKFQVQPQMVDKYEVSNDKLTYTFTLRDGLKFHDGTPVLARDCAASIQRCAKRSKGRLCRDFRLRFAMRGQSKRTREHCAGDGGASDRQGKVKRIDHHGSIIGVVKG